jgi:drug/metabolite transporter (DMT)-like permease|tara:strand:- start:44935 stop:45345 length:411 start_codon:yes stop_codon:yes gene_type:complete
MNWYIYSIISAFLLAAHFLFLKKASLSGIPLSLLIMYMWLISGVGLLIYQITKGQLSIPTNLIWIVVFATITALAGTFLLNLGVYTAPNPGYATAVGSLQVLIVVVSSMLIFGSDFSSIKILGSLLVIIGVIMLGL